MPFTQSDKTKKFVEEVKALVDSGLAKNYAVIIQALEWDKTTFSNVLNGRKNVPNDIYRKFTEVYQIQADIPIKNTDLNKQIGSIEERLIRLEGYVTILFDTSVQCLSQSSGKPIATTRAELQQALAMVLKHSMDLLRQQE